MPSKNYTLFFIFSVGFVLISIAFISILGQTSKKDGENVDIRAKATLANSLKLIGVVNSIDLSTQTVTVSQLKFESKKDDPADMGTWIVSYPSDFKTGSIGIGQRVFINADASTFKIGENTVTAIAITPLK